MADCKPIGAKPDNDGWTEWQQPTMKAYRMQCCDCGLIHEVEFEVVEQMSEPDETGGNWTGREVPNGRVSMRMRRIEGTRN